MSKKEDMTRVSAKDDDPVRKLCVRFNKDIQHTRDFKDAVAYLSLRGSGCPRKEAILFAAKNNCRVDTTKIIDGPKDHRKLRIQQVPHYMVSEGWLYGQQDYNLGTCFPSRYSQTHFDHQNNQQLEDNFDEQEIEMRKQYKEMIHRMKAYVKQINQKYNFSKESGDKLVEMVKKIVKGMKTELENRQYFELNDIRFYDAAEAIMKKRMLKEDEKNILIEKLNVFNNYENDEDLMQVQIIKINEEDQNEDNSPQKNPFFVGMFSNAVHKASISMNKSDAAKIQTANVPQLNSYAHQLKNLEQATHILEEFEKGEGEDMPNGPSGKFDRSYANQKKRRQEQMQNNLNLVRVENKAGLDGQFNQQKYFFAKNENKSLNLRKEQQDKEDLQNVILDIYRCDDEDGFCRYRQKVSEISENVGSMLHRSQSNLAIGMTDNRKKSMEGLDNCSEVIDMEIIKKMKERQDVYQSHFRNKISTSTAPRRSKLFQSNSQKALLMRCSPYSSANNRVKQDSVMQQSQYDQRNSNHKATHKSQFSNGSSGGTYILSNHPSLTNLSAQNSKNNNLSKSYKFNITPSTTTGVRLTPIHTQIQFGSKQSSIVQTPSSLTQINNLTLPQDKFFSRGQSKTAGNEQESKPKGRRVFLQPKNENEKEQVPQSRTVTWFFKGQAQTQEQIPNKVNQNEKNSNIRNQFLNQQSPSSITKVNRNSSPSSSHNSPANKLAQQYYYQGTNHSKVAADGAAGKTEREKLLLSNGNKQRKISSLKGESEFGETVNQSTAINTGNGNTNLEDTPKSFLAEQ